METTKNTESNPIFDLILAQRELNDQSGDKPSLLFDGWLLKLQSKMGELATVLAPLQYYKKPDHWQTNELIVWQASYQKAINSAVQMGALAVESGEWLSRRSGWENNAREVLRKALGTYKYDGHAEPIKSYHHMVSKMGNLGYALIEKSAGSADTWSYTIRDIIFYNCELIYLLQQKGGQGA